MIIVDHVVLSDDIKESFFVCDLKKCKGACCIEGDLGAPLEEKELTILNKNIEKIKPFLSKDALTEIEKQGPYIKDEEGDFSTTTINQKECVYAIYDENNILKCGIEKAFIKNKIDFQKPISCHLYPIRVTKYEMYDALNYNQWHICNDACLLGEKLKIPVYKFLKEPLIRNYGPDWHKKLEKEIKKVDAKSDTNNEKRN